MCTGMIVNYWLCIGCVVTEIDIFVCFLIKLVETLLIGFSRANRRYFCTCFNSIKRNCHEIYVWLYPFFFALFCLIMIRLIFSCLWICMCIFVYLCVVCVLFCGCGWCSDGCGCGGFTTVGTIFCPCIFA